MHVAHVALAMLAMKHARAPQARLAFDAAALVTYVYLPGVARVHHPWGWMYGWRA